MSTDEATIASFETPADDISGDDKLIAFAEIISKMRDTNEKIVVPILKKIETNTSIFRKAERLQSKSSEPRTIAHVEKSPQRHILINCEAKRQTDAAVQTVTAVHQTRSVLEAASKKSVDEESQVAIPVKRDSRGKFISRRSQTQDVDLDKSGGPYRAKRGGLATMAAFGMSVVKSGVQGKKSIALETAARAAMGPMYDAAMEIKDQYDQFRDAKDNLKEQYKQFKGDEETPGDKKITKSIQASEKEDKKRHDELIETILKKEKIKKAGLPYPRDNGPSAHPSGDDGGGIVDMITGGRIARYAGPLIATLAPILATAALPVTLGIVATAAVGAAAYSAKTGKSNFINDAVKNATGLDAGKAGAAKEHRQTVEGTKRINAMRRAEGKKELAYDPVTGMVKGLSEQQTAAYLSGVKSTEAGKKDNLAVNSYGFSGRYQFGADALADEGLVDKDKLSAAKKAAGRGWYKDGGHKAFLADPANWKIAGGQETFLKNPALQDKAMVNYTNRNITAGYASGALSPASSPEQVAGYAKAAHLKGAKGANDYFLKGIDSKDAYGTSVSKYAKQGADSVRLASKEQQPISVATKQPARKRVFGKEESPLVLAVSPSRVAQPERINPESYIPKTAGMNAGGKGTAPPAPSIPGLDKLIATMTKFVGQQGQQQGEANPYRGQQIPTEFDDTMLTLMAYDRV